MKSFHEEVTKNTLHPLAQKAISAKRIYKLPDEENGTACRSPFARDRDRIIFCKSFRRLSHKTQLYISDEGNEHNRTRLTHTIEVAQIANTIARNLSVNEDLVEAIAYGHDVGHAPFGHAGERQIDLFLKGDEPLPRRIARRMETRGLLEEDFKGDFRHNFQSVRILSFLEKYHTDYEGTNLTIQCLEGILKHTKLKPIRPGKGKFCNYPGIRDGIFTQLDLDKPFSVTLEGQIVNIADEIAQITHDINDAIRNNALSIDILKGNKHINKVLMKDRMRYSASVKNCHIFDHRIHCQVMSAFINYFTRYVISEIRNNIDKNQKTIKNKKGNLFKLTSWVLPDNEIADPAYKELSEIKEDIVLNNFTVNRMDSRGQYIIRNLFDAYINNPRQLPDSVLDAYCKIKKVEIAKNGKEFIADWIKKKGQQYKITERLEQDEIRKIMCFLERETDGREFRQLPPALIEKMLPYLAIDGDFIRAIADHITSMTDKYAKEEYEKLYQ